MRIRTIVIVLGCLAVFLALGNSLYAQGSSSTLDGRVVSKAGKPVAGATVTATNLSSGKAETATTDADGRYRITGLAAGKYSIQAEGADQASPIFQETIGAGQSKTISLRLQPKLKEEVTVTGSLIPRPTLKEMSPVATLDVEELSYRGVTKLEDLLTSLPQVFNAQNSTVANGASGTATVDLRFLGPQRTLVLIDGRRMPVGDAGGLVGASAIAPDLNFIPAALVKRVDILTGGASSVYGADAVAGVVNFILDRDFEGMKFGVSGSLFEHNNSNDLAKRINADAGFTVPRGETWDGHSFDAYVAFGSKFAEGKGHATMYIDYRKTAALTKASRDYTHCSVSGLDIGGPYCGGSSTIPTGRFLTNADTNYDWTLDTGGSGDTFKPRDGLLYNYASLNYMQRPDNRFAAGGFLNYEINPHAQGYLEVMLMDDRTDAQIAPSGNFFVTGEINCDNPMLSADEREKICGTAAYPDGPPADGMASLYIGRRNVEGGNRTDLLSHQSFRLVGGMKGEIDKVWSYDAYGLHAETRVPETYVNDMNSQRLQQALLVTGDPNDPTTWQCMSEAARAEGCVPWNIFKVGGVTQAALDYLSLPLVSTSDVRTQLMSGKVTGDLKGYGWVIPSASEGIQVAVGAEYRKEHLEFNPDLAYRMGWGAGQGGSRPAVRGDYDVREYFMETAIPLVQGATAAKDLTLELGYRNSNYNYSGSFNTWKAQAAWAPMSSLKFRTGFNRATRAPNVAELFSPQAVQLNSGATTDPCAGESPTFTATQCANTGVPIDAYGTVLPSPADQYNVFAGGNPQLQPEIADTRTFGVVITPSALPTFSATLDYYDIKLKQTIGSLNADSVIKECGMTGNTALCDLIHRDPSEGPAQYSLWITPNGYTTTLNNNIGDARASGVDLDLAYSLPAGNSFLNFNVKGTYLLKSSIDAVIGGTALYSYDCVGYFGNTCGQPSPKWRHLSRIGWETGNLVLTLGWRMIGSVTVDAASSDKGISDPGSIPAYKANGSYEYGSKNYFDLAASYKVKEWAQLTVGVNNIFDKEPPMGIGFSPNDFGTGFYGMYDPYGRVIHWAADFKF
jgi:iron complex outermembrane recepter protein